VSEKLDEMVETFRDGVVNGNEGFRDGLRAVLEAHVNPMLAEAYSNGAAGAARAIQLHGSFETPDSYAARIIADLTKEPKP